MFRRPPSAPPRASAPDIASPCPIPARALALQSLSGAPLDLLIIGGGIVGSGIARDAAMRGLRVGLVEQHDFAFGTSSRSSRLLHGGLRYLAQGRIGLVHEASVEKKIIHQIAPHLAAPLPFIFPTYRGNRNWVLWQLKLGVKVYDLLCGGRNLGKSKWLSPAEVSGLVPELQRTGLTGAVRYYDGLTQDARLTLDTLRSAAHHGAVVVNYCRWKDGRRNGLWRGVLEDRLSGSLLEMSTRTVVNATGPWAEGVPHSQVKLRLTKGVHLVVQRARLPVPDTVVMAEGKRILFAIPWGERTILGTTDTDYEGSLEDVRPDASDLEYVLAVANRYFPSAKLERADVISAWAGVRPLVADPKGDPSDISRSHEIHTPEPGWWDVAGGKLTTYRLMAEQAVDQLVGWLEQHGNLPSGSSPCRTAAEPLLPPSATDGVSGLLPPPVSRRVAEHYVRSEWAVHLDDIMVRRSGWHYYFPEAPQIAERVSGWLAELLGWTESERTVEMERYARLSGLPSRSSASNLCPSTVA